jgi:hypothetical protein
VVSIHHFHRKKTQSRSSPALLLLFQSQKDRNTPLPTHSSHLPLRAKHSLPKHLFFCLFLCFKNILKKFNFFIFLTSNLYFFMISDYFDTLISKIIFKKYKKYYFNAFPNKKHLKKQPQLYFQTPNIPQPALDNTYHSPIIFLNNSVTMTYLLHQPDILH